MTTHYSLRSLCAREVLARPAPTATVFDRMSAHVDVLAELRMLADAPRVVDATTANRIARAAGVGLLELFEAA